MPDDIAASAAAPELEAALTVPPDLTAAAFFDVDNTMMVGASIFHFAKGLAARKFFSWTDLVELRRPAGPAAGARREGRRHALGPRRRARLRRR